MPVWLRNLQNKVLFNESLLKMRCCFLLNAFGAGRFDTSVVCVSERRIRQLNSTYRNEDTPTDVLSFPYHEDIQPGVLPSPERECDFNLGDIILAVPYVNEQCREEGVELMDRLSVLVTHGLSHLLGYTHDSLDAARQMVAKEKSILTSFNNAFGTRVEPLTKL